MKGLAESLDSLALCKIWFHESFGTARQPSQVYGINMKFQQNNKHLTLRQPQKDSLSYIWGFTQGILFISLLYQPGELFFALPQGNAKQCDDFHRKLYQTQLQWLKEELPKSKATWQLGPIFGCGTPRVPPKITKLMDESRWIERTYLKIIEGLSGIEFFGWKMMENLDFYCRFLIWIFHWSCTNPGKRCIEKSHAFFSAGNAVLRHFFMPQEVTFKGCQNIPVSKRLSTPSGINL